MFLSLRFRRFPIAIDISQHLAELFHYWKLSPIQSNKTLVANWILSCTNIEFVSDIIVGARYDYVTFQEKCRQQLFTYYQVESIDKTSHSDASMCSISAEIFDDIISPQENLKVEEEETISVSSLSESSKPRHSKVKKKLKKRKKVNAKLSPTITQPASSMNLHAPRSEETSLHQNPTKTDLMNELLYVKGSVGHAIANFNNELFQLKENIQNQVKNDQDVYFSVGESQSQSNSNYEHEIAELKVQMRDMLSQLRNVQKQFLDQTNKEIKLLKVAHLTDENTLKPSSSPTTFRLHATKISQLDCVDSFHSQIQTKSEEPPASFSPSIHTFQKSLDQSDSFDISQEMLLDRVKKIEPLPSLDQENATIRDIVVKDRWKLLKKGLLRLVHELKEEKGNSERFHIISLLSLIPNTTSLTLLQNALQLALKFRHISLAVVTIKRLLDLISDSDSQEASSALLTTIFSDISIFQTIFESFKDFPHIHYLTFDMIKLFLLNSSSPSKYDDIGSAVCSHLIAFSTTEFGTDFGASEKRGYIILMLDLWCILTETSAKNRYRLGTKSACLAVHALLTKYLTDLDIIKKLMKFLFMVTKESSVILNRLGECQFCELLIHGLHVNMKTTSLVELFARGILILCTNRHRPNQSRFGTIDHLNMILHCLDWSSKLKPSESPPPSLFTKLSFMLEGVLSGNESVLQIVSTMPAFFKTFQAIIQNYSSYSTEILITTCKFISSVHQYPALNVQLKEFCPLIKSTLDNNNESTESRSYLRKIYKKLSKNEQEINQISQSVLDVDSLKMGLSPVDGDPTTTLSTPSRKSPTPPQTQRKSSGNKISSHRKLIEQAAFGESDLSVIINPQISIPLPEFQSLIDTEKHAKYLNSHADAALVIQKIYRKYKIREHSKSKEIRVITLLHVIPTSNDSELIIEAVKTSIESENEKLGIMALQRINEIIKVAKESRSTSPIILLLVRKPIFLIQLLNTFNRNNSILDLGIEILTRLTYAGGACESLGNAGIFPFIFDTLTHFQHNSKLCSDTLACAVRLVMKCLPNRLRGGTKQNFSILSQILAHYSHISTSFSLLDRLTRYICHCLENSPENQNNFRESDSLGTIQQIMSDPPRFSNFLPKTHAKNSSSSRSSSQNNSNSSFLEMMCRIIINLCALNNHTNLFILGSFDNLSNYLRLYLYFLKQHVSFEELKSLSILLSSLYATTSHLSEIQTILQRIDLVTIFGQYFAEIMNDKSINPEEKDDITYTTLVLVQFFVSIPYLQHQFLSSSVIPSITHFRQKKYQKKIRKCAKSILQRIHNGDQSEKDDDEGEESVGEGI